VTVRAQTARRAARTAGAVGLALLLAGCAGAEPITPAPAAVTSVAPTPASVSQPPSSPPDAATSASRPASSPSSPAPAPSPAGSDSVPPSSVPAPDPGTGGSADSADPSRPASPPLRLTVPAIGIDSPLVDLGRNPDGTVEVPSLDDPDARPGWYRDSPPPGAIGPAIILGHVDSRRFGPGVFYHLAELQPGDTVDVARADGTVARFAVDEVRQVAKRDFPTLEVYGNLDHAGLRLITCGGEFDPAAGSYESNIIVFASLTGTA